MPRYIVRTSQETIRNYHVEAETEEAAIALVEDTKRRVKAKRMVTEVGFRQQAIAVGLLPDDAPFGAIRSSREAFDEVPKR